MSRFAPSLLLVVVTPMLLVYGRFGWSWLAGPLAALGLWLLELKSREPAGASYPHAARMPAPVD